MIKICVVTGSRAEYGLLYWLLNDLRAAADFELQLLVTGMHLAPEFGMTVDQISADGFAIDGRVHMLLSSDEPAAIAKSVGIGTQGFADILDRLAPDLMLVLGDRFEILAAVQAALFLKIPVAHIAGGDLTEGALDECIRHAITKMSHLHFTLTEDSAQRLRQMGENPDHVHVVGNPGLDHLHRLTLLDRAVWRQSLGVELPERNILVTYHPETASEQSCQSEFSEVLAALKGIDPAIGLIFTKPNADASGRVLATMIEKFVGSRPLSWLFSSLGQLRYLSTLRHVDAVLGNSSSGLLEAPSFAVPTVNIGDRQKGRIRAASVIDCHCTQDAVAMALDKALTAPRTHVDNPYGDGHTSPRIIEILRQVPSFPALVRKPFFGITP